MPLSLAAQARARILVDPLLSAERKQALLAEVETLSTYGLKQLIGVLDASDRDLRDALTAVAATEEGRTRFMTGMQDMRHIRRRTADGAEQMSRTADEERILSLAQDIATTECHAAS